MNCGAGKQPVLSEEEVRAFGLIAAGENVTGELSDYVDKLTAWGFVKIDPESGRRVALNPRQVAQRRLEMELAEAAKRVQLMAALPAMTDQLAVQFERAQWRASGGSEFIDDKDVVNARLDDVIGGAEWEILSAQPGGPRSEEQLARSLERDTAALDRGVTKRTLYRATVRDTPVTARYAAAMSTRVEGKRAEFRTLVGPFERAIIVDRKVAFVSNHLVPDAPEHSAWQITDRAVVAYIVAEFEAKWRRADPWQGEMRVRGQEPADVVSGASGVITTRRQREIMRELVEDRDQKAIGQRLGLSPRTVGVEIMALKEKFGASSLPGLVYRWAQSPDRLVDDSAPEQEDTTA